MTVLIPVPFTVTRYRCPTCSRTGSSRKRIAAHIARCWLNPAARCGQLSPCEEQVLDSEMLLQRHAMENQCCVCQKRLGSRRGEVTVQTPDGPAVQRYHTTKRSRCRRAYTQAIARDPEALARLRAEDEGRPYFPAKKPAEGAS